MRKTLFTLLLILLTTLCQSQIYKSVLPSPEFSSALEKIVLDFRINFSSIQGNSIVSQGESETFESTVKLPGAISCIIYKYHSKADTTASWQGTMYKGDDYKEASKVYENLFRLVKKSKVRWIDKSFVGFNGEMEKPAETLRFTVSTLNFELEDKRYKNFQADVEMVSNYDGWEVHLNLQTKQPDNLNNL
jgi:hypothetical protein